jgi:hypothetical protein
VKSNSSAQVLTLFDACLANASVKTVLPTPPLGEYIDIIKRRNSFPYKKQGF